MDADPLGNIQDQLVIYGSGAVGSRKGKNFSHRGYNWIQKYKFTGY